MPAVKLSRYFKMAIRLSIIYIPLLLIAMHGPIDKHPQLTGKYEVRQLQIAKQTLYRTSCADSILTAVYFDVNNSCVFEFNTPLRRWNGTYTLVADHLQISWRSPADKPVFSGIMSPVSDSGRLALTGVLGADSLHIIMHKLGNDRGQ